MTGQKSYPTCDYQSRRVGGCRSSFLPAPGPGRWPGRSRLPGPEPGPGGEPFPRRVLADGACPRGGARRSSRATALRDALRGWRPGAPRADTLLPLPGVWRGAPRCRCGAVSPGGSRCSSAKSSNKRAANSVSRRLSFPAAVTAPRGRRGGWAAREPLPAPLPEGAGGLGEALPGRCGTGGGARTGCRDRPGRGR